MLASQLQRPSPRLSISRIETQHGLNLVVVVLKRTVTRRSLESGGRKILSHRLLPCLAGSMNKSGMTNDASKLVRWNRKRARGDKPDSGEHNLVLMSRR